MEPDSQTTSVSSKALWAGRIVSALPVLFLLMDGGRKLFKPALVVDATLKVGYAETTIVPLGIVLLACTILYVVPQTSVLSAILLTAHLGGALATHPRVGDRLFTRVLFPT